jgi:outer membrane lipoprotein-sorting protein
MKVAMLIHHLKILFFAWIIALMVAAQPASFAKTTTLVQQFLQSYKKIETISCEIQKTTKGASTVRMLSRVVYKRPNFINVENISPASRRIIVDGKKLYYYQKNAAKGFSRPIGALNETWMASVKNIPGTPVAHLLKMKDIPENKLPGNKDFAIRVAYQTDTSFVVISCNTPYRLELIEFFKDSGMKNKFAEYKYSKFYEKDGAYSIPCLHEAFMNMPDGTKIIEKRYIHNLKVNTPVNDHFFNPDLFFKNVEFVDDFSKTYHY